MGRMATSPSMFLIFLGIPVGQPPVQALFLLLLILEGALFTALSLALAQAPVLARVLMLARTPVLPVSLSMSLPLDQLLSLGLALLTLDLVVRSAPTFLKGSEAPHQMCCLIVARGISSATVNHTNNPGNLCKSQSLE